MKEGEGVKKWKSPRVKEGKAASQYEGAGYKTAKVIGAKKKKGKEKKRKTGPEKKRGRRSTGGYEPMVAPYLAVPGSSSESLTHTSCFHLPNET